MNSKRNIARYILLGALELAFMFSVFKVCMFFMEVNRDKNTNDRLVDEVTSTESVTVTDEEGNVETEEIERFVVDYDGLLGINPNVRGWIRYTQAGVNYPVVQGTDNDYYLNHDYYGSQNLVGAIFIDHRNRSLGDRNVVIFGHNTTDGSMFGSLKRALNDGFFDDESNRIIEIIDTQNRSRHYEIFSIYVIPEEDYYITTDFQSDAEYREFLSAVKERSERVLESDLTGVENILTLSTCNDMRLTNKRLVIHAKLVD